LACGIKPGSITVVSPGLVTNEFCQVSRENRTRLNGPVDPCGHDYDVER